jgi:hypothetical protein
MRELAVPSTSSSSEDPALPPGCLLLPNFLAGEECRELIALAETRGFVGAESDYPPSYRDNERLVLDDELLAQRLYARLSGRAPLRLQRQDELWQLAGLNARLRFCRYRSQQAFHIHQDGVHHRGPDCRSLLTFMIYLTDGDAFEGGDTLFFDGGPGQPAPREVARVRPRAGTLILFDHALWHAGALVTRGVKHILRSDLLYRREPRVQTEEARPFTPGHAGYVWTLERIGSELLASGGRDATIRLWHESGRALGTLEGHTRSVLGLCALEAPGSPREQSLGARRLASVSRDRSLRLWDLDTRCCTHSVRAHDGAALCVLRLADGLLSGGADGKLRIWDDELEELATLDAQCGWVWSLARLDARHVACAGEDGSIRLWDLAALRCVAVLPGSAPLRCLCPGAQPGTLWSADSHGYLSAWRDVLDLPVLERRLRTHSAALRRVRLLDRHTLATASEDCTVALWGLPDLRPVQQRAHANFATDVVRLADGRLLSSSYDGTLSVLVEQHRDPAL